MARLLIVGGGCRGLKLAEEAGREGHLARVVTRTDARRARIEAIEAECWIGDPDRLGTLRGALEGVTIACWLLGDAAGTEEQLRALHGARLRAFLESAIDTTVRGFLYETSRSSAARNENAGASAARNETAGASAARNETDDPSAVRAEGKRIAREITRRNSIPLALVDADPADLPRWLEQVHAALASLLA